MIPKSIGKSLPLGTVPLNSTFALEDGLRLPIGKCFAARFGSKLGTGEGLGGF